MKTVLTFSTLNSHKLPPEFENDDVRFSDSFAEYFIEFFSKPGDVVFDPFAGFGTSLFAAEKLKRQAFGIELLPDRVEYIKRYLKNPAGIINESSLDIDNIKLPDIDLVLTSPPYMQKINHPEYPFANYQVTGQGYEDYLCDIADIFKQIDKKLKPGAFVIIEVSNLQINDVFTPLAWDIASSVGLVLNFLQEIIIEWESDNALAYGFGYDHSYSLIFKSRNKI